jgi:tetratricopeptide (TPR) repeat protein
MPAGVPLKALSVLAALAFAAALPELVLRARRGPPPSEELWSDEARYMREETAKPFFALKTVDGVPTWVADRARSTAPPFPRDKPPGETRVFVVGESVAQRLSARLLERHIGDDEFLSGVRVVNCGMGAYDSVLAADVADEIVRDGADLVVVLVGNNNGSGPEGGYAAYRVNRFLRRLWTWRAAQDWLARRVRRPPSSRERMARFERGLRRILSAARAARVQAVVATLPVNERGDPSPGELPLQRPKFLAAWIALERGRAREAAASFRAELSERPDDAMTHYELARSLDASGDGAAAAAEYDAAVEAYDLDRCAPSRNALIRRVAAEEGAAVADLDALFRARAPRGVPGWESFVDGVHWRSELDAAVAETIARAAARGAAPASADDVAAAARLAKGVPARWSPEDARSAAMRAISDAVQVGAEYDPPVLWERDVAEFMQADAADPAGLRAWLDDPGRVEAAFDANEWTRFLKGKVRPSWAIVLAHAGEALARRGKTARALELLERGSRLERESALARFLLGKVLLEAGRREEAERAWDGLPADARERALVGFYRGAR